jgi:cell pole-organizing protein PopZ
MPEPEPEPELVPEPEAELVLSDFESEAIAEEPLPVEEPALSEPEPAPVWESEPREAEPLMETERPSFHTNGHSGEVPSESSHRTFEDSVRDMLRPMLRQWLDENMPRMVTAALKDELRDNPARFQRD